MYQCLDSLMYCWHLAEAHGAIPTAGLHASGQYHLPSSQHSSR